MLHVKAAGVSYRNGMDFVENDGKTPVGARTHVRVSSPSFLYCYFDLFALLRAGDGTKEYLLT